MINRIHKSAASISTWIPVETRKTWAAVASILIAIGVTIGLLCLLPFWNSPVYKWREELKETKIRFDEPAKLWIERQAKSSESLFQTAGLLVAALWGVVIVKEGYAGLATADWKAWSTFVCANYFLILSFVSHVIFNNDLAAVLSLPTDKNGEIPIGTAPVWGYLIIQVVSLLLGCLASAATFLIIHVPTPAKPADNL